MLAVIINDSAFAVVLGAFLTSCIALQAWMVKTLSGLSVRVESNSDRIDRLETARWSQRGAVRLKLLAVVVIVMVALLWSALYLKVEADAQKRFAACTSRQNLYDGHIAYTSYLADEFKITDAQEQAALRRLRKALGPRPVC